MARNRATEARIERFNPHRMDDADILHLATGRDAKAEPLIKRLKALASGETMPATHRHAMVMGPRGIGKSFFLRLIQARLRKSAPALPFVLLPEENYNIRRPQDLLINVRARLLGEHVTTTPRKGGDRDDWLLALRGLRESLTSVCDKGGQAPPYLVVGLENFDRLVRSAFGKPQQESLLRDLIESDAPISFLVSTLRGDVDTQSEKRLFHAFDHVRLDSWTDRDFQAFFEKRSAGSAKVRMAQKVRAIAAFTGGNPRMGVILSDLGQYDDPLSVAETLKALVDELTPYYQNILDNLMPDKSRHLFDALIRDGEPESQTGLANRLGETQADFAQAFNWLIENEYLHGEREKGGRAILYKVADRLFAHYYRQRLGLFGEGVSTLEVLTEFLAAYYTSRETGRHARALFDANRRDDAAIFARLTLSKEGIPKEALQELQPELLDRIVTVDGLMTEETIGPKGRAVEENLGAFQSELDQLSATDRERRAALLTRIGQCFRLRGKWQDALEAYEKAVELYRSFGAVIPIWRSERQIARALIELGRMKDARSHISALLDEIENYSGKLTTDLIASQARSLLFAGWITWRHEDTEAAESYFSRAVEVAMAIDEHGIASEIQLFQSQLLRANQDFSGALERARSAIENARSAESSYDELRATLEKSQVLLNLNDPNLAADAATRVISLADEENYGHFLRDGYSLSALAKQALGDGRSALVDTLKALSTAISLGDDKGRLYGLAGRVFSLQPAADDAGIWALKNILTDEEFEPFLTAGLCAELIEPLRPGIPPGLAEMLLGLGKSPPDSIKELVILSDHSKLYGQAYGAIRQQGAYETALAILDEYEKFLHAVDKLAAFPGLPNEADFVSIDLHRASVHFMACDTVKANAAVASAAATSTRTLLSDLETLTFVLSSQWKARDRAAIFADGMLIYNSVSDALAGSDITHLEILLAFLAALFKEQVEEPALRDLADELIGGEAEHHRSLTTAVDAALRYRTAKADAAPGDEDTGKKIAPDPEKILQRLDPDVATAVRILVGETDKKQQSRDSM